MKNILFCPIDLPKCPVIPKVDTTNDFLWWRFGRLTTTPDFQYQRTDWLPEIKETYPDLINWFKLFPIKSIVGVKLNFQYKTVEPHIDFIHPKLDEKLWQHNNDNEPCGYRILLKGTRKNKMYVVDGEEKIYCTLPEETDVYVLGHTTALHGVDLDYSRLTIYTHFEVDEDLHQKLIMQSIDKYNQYVVYKK
jgi:hypothetical protein